MAPILDLKIGSTQKQRGKMEAKDLSGEVFFNLHNLRIKKSEIWGALQQMNVSFGSISAIILFGSCLKEKFKEERGFWGTIKKVIIPPNDLDIAVFLKEDSKIDFRVADARVSRKVGDSYGCWWETNCRNGFLHFLFTTEEKWSNAYLNNESDAIALLTGYRMYGDLNLNNLAQEVNNV